MKYKSLNYLLLQVNRSRFLFDTLFSLLGKDDGALFFCLLFSSLHFYAIRELRFLNYFSRLVLFSIPSASCRCYNERKDVRGREKFRKWGVVFFFINFVFSRIFYLHFFYIVKYSLLSLRYDFPPAGFVQVSEACVRSFLFLFVYVRRASTFARRKFHSDSNAPYLYYTSLSPSTTFLAQFRVVLFSLFLPNFK